MSQFHATLNLSTGTLTIQLKGLGPVPSFKNGKMLCRGRLITAPKKQRFQESLVLAIVSALRSCVLISDGETPTGCSRELLMLQSMPVDDCRQVVPEMFIRAIDGPEDSITIELKQLNECT